MAYFKKIMLIGIGIILCSYSAWAGQLTVSSVSASSEQSGNGVTNVIDNDQGTRWAAGDSSYPQWVKIDLGSLVYLDSIVLSFYNPATRTYTYNVQASTDDKNYSTVVTSRESGSSTISTTNLCTG